MGGFAPFQPLGTLNVALSNFAKEYRNNAFVSELLAPRVPVDRQSFQYLIFDRSGQRLDVQTVRAPGDKPQSIRMTYTSDTYFCKSHALDAKVPYEHEQYALGAGFSLKQKATMRLIAKLLLDREVALATLATDTSKVTNYKDLGAGGGVYPWDDYTAGHSHPIQDVDVAKGVVRQAGVMPTDFIISDPVFQSLRNHPDIVDRFKYTTPGAIGVNELSAVFGLKVTVASGIVLSKTNAGSWIWGANALVCHVEPSPSMEDLSAFKTFVWSAAPDTVNGYGVMEWPDPHRSVKADWISTDMYWDMKVTGAESVYLFQNCVTPAAFGNIAAPTEG